MEKLTNIAKNLTQDYRGEWREGIAYNKNDVVRVNGAAYICKTDKYATNDWFGEKYKPENDTQGWDRYSSGYMWTGQWMENGTYYPGDIVNYNGDRYVCMRHGRMIHPIYDRSSETSYWQKITADSNQNKANRILQFNNRNPMGWNDRNMGFIPGRLDNGAQSNQGYSFINGEFESVHIARHSSYGYGGSEYGFGGSQHNPAQSTFQWWDHYDNYRNSSVTQGTTWSRPRCIQTVGDDQHMYGFLFDNGEVFWAGWMGSGEHGDGGTTNRYYSRRVGRTNNSGGGFDYNQQIQQYQSTHGNRGQGFLRDIQAIKIGTTSSTNSNSSSSVNGALDINGQLWTWGYNGHTGLGRNFKYNNNWYNSYVPAIIPQQYFDNRKLVDFWLAGGNHQYGFALDQDGNLWGWGYNAYDQLGVGNDQYTGAPRKILYNWEKHGGIKKIATAGYNTYYLTVVLTNDGVLHQTGLLQQIGSNLYSSGSYDGDEPSGSGFGPMQKVWWDRARSLEVSGAGLRSFWNMTDLYNDVEDFWLSSDQNNARLYIKQRSTGIIFGVGTQAYNRFNILDYLANENQNTGDFPWTNVDLQYPLPVFTGYSDVIDISRIGSGNNEWRQGLFLNSSQRCMVIGAGSDPGKAKGISFRSGRQAMDNRNKLPWEFDITQSAGNYQANWFSAIASVQGSQGDGWWAICQDDRLFYVGNQTWPASFDPARQSTQSSVHSYNMARVET